jgi:uncharacterized protein YndB with AHSA1/START domain
MAVQRGCLLLADITGYTKYLAGVELEHSHDILADLIGAMVTQLQGRFKLAKLEGDAVFCYAQEEDDVDGAAAITTVEATYFAFQERLRNIKYATTCACDACRLIPDLTLKVLLHAGQFVLHEVVGNRELIGPDVVLAHRLLKNTVTERTGLRGYALLTESCVERFGLDPRALGMREHREAYEDVGDVNGWIHDLEARWREAQKRTVAYLGPGEAQIDVEVDLPAAPAIVWDWLTSPAKRVQWQPDTERVDEFPVAGIRGAGTTNHCVHGGGQVVTEEILDWKPFRYFTDRSSGPMGRLLGTIELTPLEAGTKVSFRMHPDDEETRSSFAGTAPILSEWIEQGLHRIGELVAAERATPEGAPAGRLAQ